MGDVFRGGSNDIVLVSIPEKDVHLGPVTVLPNNNGSVQGSGGISRGGQSTINLHELVGKL